MKSQLHAPAADEVLEPWMRWLDDLSQAAINVTIGLISGSRKPSDRHLVDRLAAAGLNQAATKGLVIRLVIGNDMAIRRQLRTARHSEQLPIPAQSPLGSWRDITLPVSLGSSGSQTLEQLPRWLSEWKRQHRRIFLDLGAIDQPMSRVLGRYCDTCLLLLGPATAASPLWIRQHLEDLKRCDTHVAGSLVLADQPIHLAS